MPASSRTDINRPQAQMSPAGLLVDYGNEITWWRHVYDADGVPGVARRFAEGGTPTYDEKFPRKMHPELYTARTEGRITELGAIVRSVRDAAGQGTLAGADLAQASDRILELLHGNTARGQWHPAFEARSAVSLARELTPILLKMLSADRAMTVAYGSDKGDQVLELLERSAPFKGSLKEQSSCETGVATPLQPKRSPPCPRENDNACCWRAP